jgi:hypothetical protein
MQMNAQADALGKSSDGMTIAQTVKVGDQRRPSAAEQQPQQAFAPDLSQGWGFFMPDQT